MGPGASPKNHELYFRFRAFPVPIWGSTFHGFPVLWAPLRAPFSLVFPGFGFTFSSIDFVSIFHRFSDGFFVVFSSFLDANLAPLPNLANPEFEQQYGVLRRNPCFWPPRFSCFSGFFRYRFFASIFTYFWTSFSWFSEPKAEKNPVFLNSVFYCFLTSFFRGF